MTENQYLENGFIPFKQLNVNLLQNELMHLNSAMKILLSNEKKVADEEFLTENQACLLLKRSKPTLWRYRSKKILPYIRLAGFGIRYKKSDDALFYD